ncbi:MAG: hypothetical protein ACMV1D_11365, partial [Macromonas sp.]
MPKHMPLPTFAQAAAEFKKGNYTAALTLYKRLGEQFGARFVAANVALCERRLAVADVTAVTSAPKPLSLQDANLFFYKQGRIGDTKVVLDTLLAGGAKFEKKERDFKAFVDGLARLKQGWPLPPRQPNAGVFTRHQHLLYCLHQSVPHATNGYATRSHGIAVGLQQAGWRVRATTRPGFTWDAGVLGLSKGYHQAEVDGVTYAAVAGWNLNTTPLD